MKRTALIAVVALTLASPAVASAQGGDGFLFKRPRVSVTVRAGYALPTAGGELFDYATDEFIALGADTLSTLDFDGPYLGGELAFRPGDRWEVALGVGWTRKRAMTEYRRWIDADGFPIMQETTFQVVYTTLGAKYALLERGRQIGRLAYVPSRVTPWVGGGLGVSAYKFIQSGDFVDSGTSEIFSDYLETSDEGFIVYGGAGLDMTLFKNAIVTAEARYTLSSADVEYPYSGFNDIDLGGLQLMVGLGFQF